MYIYIYAHTFFRVKCIHLFQTFTYTYSKIAYIIHTYTCPHLNAIDKPTQSDND